MDDRPTPPAATKNERSDRPAAPFALRPETRHWLLGLARAAVGAAAEAYRDGRLDELEERLGAYRPAAAPPGAGQGTASARPGAVPSPVADEVASPAAAFVTLTVNGELRGCMGRLDPERALWENIRDAAIAAAIGDPRFPPLVPEEVPGVRIEVSILGPMTEIADAAAFDADRHGIVVEADGRRALLLPKVAKEQGWDEMTTLAAVCRKAGLPPDAWRWPGARLWVFEAEDFGEAEWAGGVRPAAEQRPGAGESGPPVEAESRAEVASEPHPDGAA